MSTEPTSTKPLNIYQRILAIMKTMGAIGKGGQASYGETFKYHKIDDIDDKLREAMIQHGVVSMVKEIRDRELDCHRWTNNRGDDKSQWYSECLIEVEFINVDDPADRVTTVGWGQGLDNSDKATGKALSYALKAIYLSMFHLRGQPDNEQDNFTRDPAPDPIGDMLKPTAPAPASKPAQKPEPKPAAKPAPPKLPPQQPKADQPKPATEPMKLAALIEYDKLPQNARELVDACNQCHDMEDFQRFMEGFFKEPIEIQEMVKRYTDDREKVILYSSKFRNAKSIEEVNKIASDVSFERNDRINEQLRGVYTETVKSFKRESKKG